MKKTAAILGATGFVGQRFVQLLDQHPWFEVSALAASEKSVGKSYAEAAKWVLETPMPTAIKNQTVVACTPDAVGEVGVVFSCLPNDLAGPTEEAFAKDGAKVISKASAHRMDPEVPLIVPEINPDHDDLTKVQQKKRNWKGFISCDPNCSTTPLALTLKPLLPLGIVRVHVTTLQALSGAGYPGVASLDALGNVIPFIAKEEEKIEQETPKILGKLDTSKTKIQTAAIPVSASCNRVPVLEGHLENVFVEFRHTIKEKQIQAAWAEFHGAIAGLKLPSAQKPVQYVEGADRPQHRLDVWTGKGMTTSIGRLRADGPNRFKYACLSHNTIQGAAGGAILHAEVLKAQGTLD